MTSNRDNISVRNEDNVSNEANDNIDPMLPKPPAKRGRPRKYALPSVPQNYRQDMLSTDVENLAKSTPANLSPPDLPNTCRDRVGATVKRTRAARRGSTGPSGSAAASFQSDENVLSSSNAVKMSR